MTDLAVPPTTVKRLAYLGTPELAVPPLRALVDAGFEVPLVVSQPDRRRGRGSRLIPSPVKQAALDAGIEVAHDVAAVTEAQVDLAVVVAFGQLIPTSVLAQVPMINSHFSLLPRWRGAAPIQRAILAGDTETGVCLMAVAEGLDSGGVYRRHTVAIGENESASDLTDRLVAVACPQMVDALTEGLGQPEPQNGEPVYAAKMKPSEFELDFDQPAEIVNRSIRLGGAWTTAGDARFKIWRAQPVDTAVGSVGELSGDVVACGEGGLRLISVQPAGKPKMAMTDWVNGHQPSQGFCFG